MSAVEEFAVVEIPAKRRKRSGERLRLYEALVEAQKDGRGINVGPLTTRESIKVANGVANHARRDGLLVRRQGRYDGNYVFWLVPKEA